MLAFLPFITVRQDAPLQIQTALVIGGVSLRGRRPTPEDAIVQRIVAGNWAPPREGQEQPFRSQKMTWKTIHADKDGWFNDDALENGYLSCQIDEPEAKDLILNCKGDSLVYVNGVPRAGDPYAYGYLNLPIHLNQGSNELLFVAGRGRISASLKSVTKPIWLQTDDATLPDILTTDKGDLLGSMVVCNATGNFTKDLKIRVTNAKNHSSLVALAPVPASSDRKSILHIPASGGLELGKNSLQVELLQDGKTIDSATLEVQVKKPLDLQKRTFISTVDGSVQYYAVWPASKPSPSNALVLTLHGASVEAIGQAAAYAQKSWATIVAPTNRRPYGFDWEGVGRLDALEVLNLAKKAYPHDPKRVDLTGHSMGGHGTWSIGTLYPNLFASISPSAGWISFWSYAGGWTPPEKSQPLDLLRRSMNVGDTMGRVENTLEENVYILHGAVDDNVPVEQARTMKAKLESIHHPNVQYHEQPGANHWWGNQCVDWPPIFQTIQDSKLNFDRNHIDFTTQDPSVSATYDWITVEQQTVQLAPSHVVADRSANGDVSIAITNVSRLKISNLRENTRLVIDGETVTGIHSDNGSVDLVWTDGRWTSSGEIGYEKGPDRGGPFKQIFNHRFLFVVGTKGSEEENRWALNAATYQAETMMYRGNGAVDIVLDKDFSSGKFRNRNILLFGNAKTNGAWTGILGRAPVHFDEGSVKTKLNTFTGDDLGGLVLYPKPGEKDTLVGALTGTGLAGFKQNDRVSLFSSGVDYPDWIVFSPRAPQKVLADGFFSNKWQLDQKQSAVAGD